MNFREKLTKEHAAELSIFIKSNARTAEEIKRAQAIMMIEQNFSNELEKSIMKCNPKNGKLFLTEKVIINKVAYESLHAIKNRRKNNNI